MYDPHVREFEILWSWSILRSCLKRDWTLKTICLCDAFSRQMTSRVFYHCAFITVFHRCCQPLSTSTLCSLKVLLASKDRNRDMKRKHQRRRCASACKSMAVHTTVCVLSLIQYKPAIRWERIKTGAVWTKRFFALLPSASFGRRSCLEGCLEYFLALECFLIPPEAVFLCEQSCLNCVCVLEAHGIPHALQMSGCLIINPRISRLCELYYSRYLYMLSLHTHAHPFT